MKYLGFVLLSLVTTCSLAQTTTDYLPVGSFLFAEVTDAMTDQHRSVIFTYEQNPRGRQGVFRMVCDGPELFIGLYADEYLDSESSMPVTYRFDQNEPVTETWVIRPEGSEVNWHEPFSRTFLDELRAAKQVAFRVYNYEGIEYTYIFDISDSGEAISMLHCVQ
jgi:hypothetical protein